MQNFIGYLLISAFVLLAIYFMVKGFIVGIHKPLDKLSYKFRAIYYTVSVVCGLAGFAVYYPTLDGLICLPIALIGIWTEYLVAISQINRVRK